MVKLSNKNKEILPKLDWAERFLRDSQKFTKPKRMDGDLKGFKAIGTYQEISSLSSQDEQHSFDFGSSHLSNSNGYISQIPGFLHGSSLGEAAALPASRCCVAMANRCNNFWMNWSLLFTCSWRQVREVQGVVANSPAQKCPQLNCLLKPFPSPTRHNLTTCFFSGQKWLPNLFSTFFTLNKKRLVKRQVK